MRGPWPQSILSNTTLLAFKIGVTTVRQRFCSAMTHVTARSFEVFYRSQLTQKQALLLERHETIAGLLKLLSTLEANCWLDPSITCSLLKRLKDISDVNTELTACEGRLSQILEAQKCLEPILDIAQVRCTQVQRSAIERDGRKCTVLEEGMCWHTPANLKFTLGGGYDGKLMDAQDSKCGDFFV
jgi:hypothetical protein